MTISIDFAKQARRHDDFLQKSFISDTFRQRNVTLMGGGGGGLFSRRMTDELRPPDYSVSGTIGVLYRERRKTQTELRLKEAVQG